LDTSVLVKVLVEEADSDRAVALFAGTVEKQQVVVLPALAWAELGTVLQKKCRVRQVVGKAGSQRPSVVKHCKKAGKPDRPENPGGLWTVYILPGDNPSRFL